jgi:YD repeat-containing protein
MNTFIRCVTVNYGATTAAILFLGNGGSAKAQLLDRPVEVPVSFHARANLQPIQGGEPSEFDGYLGGGNIYAVGEGAILTQEAVTNLRLDTEYDLWGAGIRWNFSVVELRVPFGLRILVDGKTQDTVTISPSVPYAKVMVVAVHVPDSGPTEPSALAAGNVLWKIGLGKLSDGNGAGYLSIANTTLDPTVFTPQGLAAVTRLSPEVDVVKVSGQLRQVKTESWLADIVTVVNGYEIRFYKRNDYSTTKSGTPPLYQIPNSNAWVVKYYVENGPPQNYSKLRITKYQGTVTQVSEATLVNGVWTGAAGVGATIVRTVTKTDQISGSDTIRTEIVSNDQGVISSKTKKTLRQFAPAIKELVEQIDDFDTANGGKAYTTTLDYYISSADLGSFRKVKWSKFPEGSWVKYDYYNAPGTGRHGRVWRMYQPFLDNPVSPDLASPTTGAVTTFDYSDDADQRIRGRLILQEKRIDNVMVAKTTYTYSIVTNSDGRQVVVTTTRRYFGSGASDYLEDVTKTYDTAISDDWRLGRKVFSTTSPDYRRVAYGYQGGTFDITTKVFTPGAGNYWRTIVFNGSSQSSSGARWVQALSGGVIENIYLRLWESTAEVTIDDINGRVVRKESYVLSSSASGPDVVLSSTPGVGDFTRLGWVDLAYDPAGKLVSQTDSRGRTSCRNYLNGLLEYEEDASGTRINYPFYDGLERVLQSTKVGAADVNGLPAQPDITTAHAYDADSHLLRSEVGTGAEKLVAQAKYDLGGRLQEEIDENGVITKYVPSKASGTDYYGKKSVQIIERVGSTDTILSEVMSEYHRDGRLKWVIGSGAVNRFMTYQVLSDGKLKVVQRVGSLTSPRYTETITDWLGRVLSVTEPTTIVGQTLTTSNFYSPTTGQLERTSTPGLGDTYYVYDAHGNLVREGIDVDGGAGLQDLSKDRISEHQSRYVQDGNGHIWLQTQTVALPDANSAIRIIASRQEERLTGFATDVTVETCSWANELLPTPSYAALPVSRAAKAVTKIYRTEKRVEVTKTSPGISSGEVAQVLNGLATRKVAPAGAKVDYYFDALGRPYRELKDLANGNPANGPTTIDKQIEYYFGKSQRYRVKGPDASGALVTQGEYEYNSDGRLKSEKNALNKFSRFEYTPRGETAYVWGEAVNPAKHTYNSYGQQETLTTYRTGTDWSSVSRPVSFQNPGDVTTWVYDEATGLQKEKRDALHTQAYPRAVTYAYDSFNRLETRTWARGAKTTYGYDSKTGEILTTDYTTPSHW